MTELDRVRDWIGKGNREDQTVPGLLLREGAQQLGLIRKIKGRLVRGEEGGDDPRSCGCSSPEPLAGLGWAPQAAPQAVLAARNLDESARALPRGP